MIEQKEGWEIQLQQHITNVLSDMEFKGTIKLDNYDLQEYIDYLERVNNH